MKVIYPLLLISFIFTCAEVFAQNEVARERISLEGLQEIGFTANLEGSRTVVSNQDLTPTTIRQAVVNELVKNNIRYVSDEEVRSSADVPFLYMHINMMELDNGLIPFSVELRLYQPVKLSLNRDLQTTASTWESGMVGIVSLDQISVIQDAALNEVLTFIDDYQAANR
ncbi:MAG: hypothetical protein ACFCU6_04555 [Balneolaceae bacterium]